MELSATIHLLGELLGDVIAEQESRAHLEAEERIRALAKARRAGDPDAADKLAAEAAALSPDFAYAIAAAFTLYFDLVNLAEEINRVRALRERERERGNAPTAESIADAVATLKARGVSHDQLAAVLRNLRVELVLTAHPTEAKRRTILTRLERISRALRALDDSDLLPREHDTTLESLRAEITALWLTDRARTARPAVTDEVRTGLYFVDSIFWEVLPRICDDLEAALAEHYPGLEPPPGWLGLASWIGGDRDGNPNVTAEVTAETLRLHRGLAVERHRRSLHDLARRLSLSARRVPLPPELLARIEARRPFPPHIAFLEKRYAAEPYRLLLSLLAADLEDASKDDMVTRLLSSAPHVTRLHTEAFTAQLDLAARAVPRRLAGGTLRAVRRQFDIFGFHAARLDVREESGRLAAALGEILRGLKIDFDFEEGTDRARAATLRQLFSAATPSLAPRPGVTAETAETWALFQLLARARAVYGRDLLGPFIISMTRGPADVLTVLLLARWAGCEDGLQIVPLFETLDDLDAAPRILAELFALDIYRAHLATCGDEQTVMIGYSDSNKDGGYVAANWALYQAQENIARTCREHGIQLTLFHGRGGTVARGGGPANRAIRAQPPGTVNGRFRLTEQGEILAARYADPDIAHRQLEQIVNAVLLASVDETTADGRQTTVVHRPSSVVQEWRSAMTAMATSARGAYRNLVYETPGFVEYWQTATPVDEISRLRIGSRPTARRGGALQVTHIRAIPWVFSWMQSRFNLPGWYGLGTALPPFGRPTSNLQPPSPEILRDMYAHWPFFRAALDNAEMSLLKADLGIAALYSDLAPDRELARAIFARIRDEYERARDAILAVSGHNALMDNEPVIQRSVQLRNPYVDPLNYLQIEMLRRLRALPDPDSPAAEPLREVIVLTINGIAAGLRNTG